MPKPIFPLLIDLLPSSRSGIGGPAVSVVVIGGTVGVAVIIASCPLSQPPVALDIILPGQERFRLTVIVGVVIGVMVGLAASSGRGIVSATVMVALPNMSANCLTAG